MKFSAPLFALLSLVVASPIFAKDAREAWDEIVLKKTDSFEYVENRKELPNVFIYGDSISIAYTPVTRRILRDKANVYRLHVNGGDSSSFVSKMKELERVMRDPALTGRWTHEWDIIHFNVGLHDLKYVTLEGKLDRLKGEQVSSLAEYEKNLRGIIGFLKRTYPKAKLVFATTTPVPEGEPGRHAGAAEKYNAVALSVLKDHPDILVNDLFALTKPKHSEWWSKPGNVHYNDEGVRAQGRKVARTLRTLLP